ncbi:MULTISPECIES: ComEC/Rec2 family competence protein [unclassified Chryseobacterium]|uniref:ComEC/Rec2 family competence protein n=1 Tax=unclassified Chryseobacterium TaxID=2593645 RepID=UPI002788296E|nr:MULTISPECIES: ComEC/Rec2 family competence protein [unclassified Chryseobacterium]MDQ1101684.1 competence protein ComEC [Chryseobacterium sp. SORGH_AS_1048]MDR6129481.1 competence protein ComEC [Chryseobacterium sp. SORGH_AS_1175]
MQKIDHTGLSKTTREFLKGIILADRTETDAVTAQDFNRSGLMHFLAISGTHIVVIFGVVYIILTRYVPVYFRKYAIVLSLVFIWMFAAFIGFGNSVVRSCIMLSVYYIYVLLQRKPDLLHSLALSAFVILVADTQQLFDVGFQLTFAAVLGIFWLNRPILRHFPKQDHFIKKIIFNTVSISIAAQLATLPLVLYYFHQFSLISVIANFAIVPFSEVIIIFSFVMTGIIALGFDFTLLNSIYDTVIRWLLQAIHWFAGFDEVFLESIPLNLVEVLLLSALVYQMRFAILKPDYRNAVRMVSVILVFLMTRTIFNIIAHQRDEVMVHRLYKNTVFSVKTGGKACFWIKGGCDKERIMKNIIHPYKASRRLNEVVVKTFPSHAYQVAYEGKIYPLN